ncbi:MAG: retroviral-like aspartic protease family protein [Thermoplasmata archaeon]
MPVFKIKLHSQGQVPIPPNAGLLTQLGPQVGVLIEIPEALAKLLAEAGKPAPTPVTGMALIDTGATSSAVDTSVVATPGINPVGTAQVGTAGGTVSQPVYPIRIQLQGVGLTINFSRVTGALLKDMGLVALLGRDMLSRMTLYYDGPNSEYTLAY